MQNMTGTLAVLKKWLWSISPVEDAGLDTDEEYKFVLLYILSYIGITLLTFYGVVAVMHREFSLAAWDLGTDAVILGNLLYVRSVRNYKVVMYANIFVIGVLFEYLFLTGGVNNTGHLWIYTFPLFTLFMLGLRTGSIVTGIFLLIPVIDLYIPDLPFRTHGYPPEFNTRFIGSFFLVFIFTFFYEYVRATTHQVTKEQKLVLENMLNDLQKTDEELKAARDRLEAKVEERTRALVESNNDLSSALSDLKQAQFQLLQTEKLASIGQLASGIAHEINTPTQYVGDNTRFFKESFDELSVLLAKYRRLYDEAKQGPVSPELLAEIGAAIDEADVDYLAGEIPMAIQQSLDGVSRVTQIVAAMKAFAHPDSGEGKSVIDINAAINDTITVSRNEWKYVAEVQTDFDDDLPHVPCHPGEFNQVILNIIINAAQAIAEAVGDAPKEKGVITISTHCDDVWAEIKIGDTGGGIPEDVRSKIFDHFFTTKEIGKGSGQGLAISHNVIVDKHGGTLTFETAEGQGTTFIIRLPLETQVKHEQQT